MSAFVLCRREGPVGHITLNRPQALNALTRGMIDALAAQLQVWRNDAAVEWVLIDSAASPRAFCAGGDIRSLWESGRTDGAEACRFFRHEYRLNAAIEIGRAHV